ncbi:hypothetical protein [Desulfosarcina sp.]|uniref:hypothetical protein n=1 Tax=Desulfosarcina sp. TaxID=2027861 RepID=UPI0029B75309|nr:hypothetical protein [Desulfosarcina sp.]MDX2451449.1 hypothetical protein [Desulfosarcina sp.]MDX2489265.1 hypothetical protein [Desulfosarcina sp.]
MDIRVDCYAGYRDEETPRRLTMGARHVNVVAVQDRWLAPDHRYFKLIGDDGSLYIIRHDPHQDSWQLIFFKASPMMAPESPG